MDFAFLDFEDYLNEFQSQLNVTLDSGLYTTIEAKLWLNLGAWEAADLLRCCECYFSMTSEIGKSVYVYANELISVIALSYNGTYLEKIDFPKRQEIYGNTTPANGTPKHFIQFSRTATLIAPPDTTGKQIQIYAIELPAFMVNTTDVSRLVQVCPQAWEMPLFYALARAEHKDKNGVRETNNLQRFYDKGRDIKKKLDPKEDFPQMKPDSAYANYKSVVNTKYYNYNPAIYP